MAGPSSSVPASLRGEIREILLNERQIAEKVRELAARIENDFRGKDLVVVALLTGTVPFLADLIRHIALPMRLDFIGVSSYRDQTTSGKLVFTKELTLDVQDRHVLVVDDILDTGRTMRRVTEIISAHKPRALKTCVLLDKKSRRVEALDADYTGFQIPDEFVVGYGLDYAERFRNLPFIGILKQP